MCCGGRSSRASRPVPNCPTARASSCATGRPTADSNRDRRRAGSTAGWSRTWSASSSPGPGGSMRFTPGTSADRQARRRQDVPVFWLVPPIVPAAQARRDSLGLDAPHTRNLARSRRGSPNMVILDARRSGYPASAFFDACHLNARGARGPQRGRRRGRRPPPRRPGSRRARWVILPPFEARDHPAQIATGSGGKPPAR